jgi:hypothetical protein
MTTLTAPELAARLRVSTAAVFAGTLPRPRQFGFKITERYK